MIKLLSLRLDFNIAKIMLTVIFAVLMLSLASTFAYDILAEITAGTHGPIGIYFHGNVII